MRPPQPSLAQRQALAVRIGTVLPKSSALLAEESFPGEAHLTRCLMEQVAHLDDPTFVRLAYERILGRPADHEGFRYYMDKLATQQYNRQQVLREFFWSHELRESIVAQEFIPSENLSPAERQAITARMQQDWDQRASEDFRKHIAAGHALSDEAFRLSGKSDLDQLILDEIDIDPAAAVLEIGCGVGRILMPFAEKVAAAYGVDISRVMIEKSREYCAARPNVRTYLTDGTLRDFADASLDFVYSFIVFQHIPDRSAIATYVREAARVLRPGGLFRFQVDGRWKERAGWNPNTYDGVTFSPEGIQELLAGTGLTSIAEWGEETHYHWVTALMARGTPTARVRFFGRGYNKVLLQDLFEQLGLPDVAARVEQVALGKVGLRRTLDHFEDRFASLSHEAFLHKVYPLLLGRAPDAAGLAFYIRLLDEEQLTRSSTIDILLTSKEFRDRVRPLLRSAASPS